MPFGNVKGNRRIDNDWSRGPDKDGFTIFRELHEILTKNSPT